jgi:hypothetical protein
VLPNQQRASVGDTFVEVLALRLVEQGGLGFLEAVEGIGRRGVFGLVGMDEEGFLAVLDLDVRVWNAWLEVKDCIAVGCRFSIVLIRMGALDLTSQV